MPDDPKPTAGDVLKVYVIPPGSSFPWVRLTHHPHGIRKPGKEVDAINASRDREELVRAIGEMVVSNSRILTEWVGGEGATNPGRPSAP